MIRINLLPTKEAQLAMGRRQQLSLALLGLALAVLVMIIPYILQAHKLSGLDQGINQLQVEISKLEQQTREVRDLDKKRNELQAKLKVIEDLKQKRIGPVRILEDLSAATPEKLWLVEFSDVNGAATITGMALDNQTIAVFMRQLQNSKYFFEVDLVETSQSERLRGGGGGDGASFKKFIIKARLDYLGSGGKPAEAPSASPPAAGKKGT
ncbi:MAG TPA: PilN domain-containing protein [Candidatus Binatia bacterium]|jgi:type IV pilus assembly protein PilN